MEFFVISITAVSFMVAVIILSYFGKNSDNKKKRVNYINEIGVGNPEIDIEVSFLQRIIKKFSTKILKYFANDKRKNKFQKDKAKDQLLERQLRLSGIFMSPEEFGSIKLTFALISTVVIAILALILPFGFDIKLLIIFLGTIMGIIGPTFFLRSKVKGHQQKIRNQLPDAIDLLGVCIEAGLSFDMAILKVSEKLSGPFVDELLIVHREISMGRARRDALQNLANSSDIPELKTFATALVQAEHLGIPIINVMRIQSVQLRATRMQLAQEKGMKAPVKIVIPMLIFIFPVIFIIILGPTVINVINQFSK